MGLFNPDLLHQIESLIGLVERKESIGIESPHWIWWDYTKRQKNINELEEIDNVAEVSSKKEVY